MEWILPVGFFSIVTFVWMVKGLVWLETKTINLLDRI